MHKGSSVNMDFNFLALELEISKKQQLKAKQLQQLTLFLTSRMTSLECVYNSSMTPTSTNDPYEEMCSDQATGSRKASSFLR